MTLVLFVILGVIAIVLLVQNLPLLLVSWLGLVVVVFAVYFGIKAIGTVRVVWLAAAAGGAIVAVAALLWLGWTSPWAFVGVVVIIAVISFLGAYALRRPSPVVRSISAVSPVLFVNPKSGGGKAADADIATIARERGIDVRVLERGEDLTLLVSDAIADGADMIGIAGGDGSLGYVATATIDAGVPFVCIPAGTRNHFARDLGLDRADLVGALDAFNGELWMLDYATVNDRVFLNVSSLGLYAETVSDPSYRDAKLETAVETLQTLEASGEKFDLRYTDRKGQTHDSADLVMVSNGRYEIGGAPRDIGKRSRLDLGRLGIVTLTVSSPAEALQAATLWAAGSIDRFHGWEQRDDSTFEIRSGSAVAVGIDGEAVRMESPLCFEIHAGAFPVAVPEGLRHGPRVSPLGMVGSVGRLWSIAISKPLT